jgi:UDP-glucose 6-dehydrogenase
MKERILLTIVEQRSTTVMVDVTEKQMEALRHGDNPFYDKYLAELKKERPVYGYEVTDLDGEVIVPLG